MNEKNPDRPGCPSWQFLKIAKFQFIEEGLFDIP